MTTTFTCSANGFDPLPSSPAPSSHVMAFPMASHVSAALGEGSGCAYTYAPGSITSGPPIQGLIPAFNGNPAAAYSYTQQSLSPNGATMWNYCPAANNVPMHTHSTPTTDMVLLNKGMPHAKDIRRENGTHHEQDMAPATNQAPSTRHASPAGIKCKWEGCRSIQTFRKGSDLIRHIKTIHIFPDAYPCRECGKKFGRKDHLQGHTERRHQPARTDY
ncbi:hypothetical protein BJX61DRAFT_543494 [Aspergillus egyptiacus]|nr:hypothetical protein BJX61DRAFT_543494 [Aspergillus egyptiacus]